MVLTEMYMRENGDIREDEWLFELLPESVNGNGILKAGKNGKLNYVFYNSKGFQYPVISYHTFKENNTSAWADPEILKIGFDGFCTSVVLDKDENIHLTIDSLSLAFKMGNVYYATNKTGNWSLSPVLNNGKTNFSSFKLDNKGIGHVIAVNQDLPFHYDLIHIESENNLVGINNNISFYYKDFVLFQNYPNPFNPKTLINYNLSGSSAVRIKLYNVLGNEIETLVNEKQNSGSYAVTFDGSNYPSGVYFYRLEIDGNVMDTKRMVLLK
ncbi:MAG: T9SS type A sorting domain-containing protein [Ignavibacteria bacterium]|nr:T9SS type A sorting domain-containing protein [Ignavibacteria bacterium]